MDNISRRNTGKPRGIVASKTVVEWVDDIDGGPAAETVTFALDGVEYEIDLSTEHATALRASMKEFIRKARTEEAAAARRTTAQDVPDEDDELGLMPAPTPADSSRHLPAPRSAIKSRISAAQLAMDVEGFDEADEPPAKRARAPRKATAEKAKTTPVKATPAKAAAKTASAKTTEKAAKAPARTTAAAKTTVKAAPAPTAKPEPAVKTAEPAPAPKTAKVAPAPKAAEPAPAPKAAEPAPKAAEPAPKPATPEPEPQRPTMASPFSQPAAAAATSPAKKDGPANPPMITFSSAKP
jgi:hypothetical protein